MTKRTTFISVLCAAALSLALTGCGGKSSGEPNPDYCAVQVDKGDSWSIIDEDGKIVAKEEYGTDEQVSDIYGKTYWVKSGDKLQLFSVDNPKKPVVDDEWSFATEMMADRAIAAKAGQPIQVIDGSGRVVQVFGKDVVEARRKGSNTIAVRKADGTYGWANKDGKVVKEGLASIEAVSEDGDLVVAKKDAEDDKYIIYDGKGKELGRFSADNVWSAGDGYINVKKGDKPVLLDKKGQTVLQIKKATYIDLPDNGCITARNADSKWGVFNLKGEELVRMKYTWVISMGGGLFVALKDGKVGVIDKDDNAVIDFDYDQISPIGNNFLVKDGGSLIIMNRSGERVGKGDFANTAATSPCDFVIRYVNVDNIVEIVDARLAELKYDNTVGNIAARLKLAPSGRFARRNSIEEEVELGGRKAVVSYVFNSWNLCEEQWHEVTKNDGWFNYRERVSDGWKWVDESVRAINVSVQLEKKMLSPAAEAVKEGLRRKGYSDDIVKDGRKVSFDTSGDNLWIQIGYDDDDPGC